MTHETKTPLFAATLAPAKAAPVMTWTREPLRPVFTPPPASVLASRPVRDLFEMHTYRRAAGSKGEAQFIARFIDSIPGIARDAHGNRWIQIGDSPVMWSAHTDSVHDAKESNATPRQRLTYGDGILTLAADEKAGCLGADCAAGAWLLREMITRGVQGLFVFHAAEEIGGIGSNAFAEDNAELLARYDACIAFDRKGTRSVITHQGDRTASDAFAKSLAAQLGPRFAPDDSGTFTDSAHYTHAIAECSNVSVGYAYAHTRDEALDVTFLIALLESVCALDVSRLVIARDPAPRWSDYGREESEDDMALAVAEHPEIVAEILRNEGFDFRTLEIAIENAIWERDSATLRNRRTR
jgi:acetylornithine deacetylase/succinyl-diaminopimelate desuccinylase-like protein